MKLKPLDDRIVIKKCDVEEKTKSGLLLPSSAKLHNLQKLLKLAIKF